MSGSDLRLNECVSLQIHDLDFDYKQIVVKNAKGGIGRAKGAGSVKSPMDKICFQDQCA